MKRIHYLNLNCIAQYIEYPLLTCGTVSNRKQTVAKHFQYGRAQEVSESSSRHI